VERCRNERIALSGFPVLAPRLSPRHYDPSAALARWLLRPGRRRYDIVHADSPWTGACALASAIAVVGAPRLVVTPHEVFTPFDLSRGRIGIRMAKRAGVRMYGHAADLIVCSSPLEMQDTQSAGLPTEKLTWIYHPVVDERAPVVASEPLEPSEPSDPDRTGLRVGYLGRLHHKKNVDMLIEAVGRAGDQVSLLIAGGGEPKLDAALRERAERVLPHRSSFVGWVADNDKSTFFSRIDVLVMPSMYECFGVAAIEALAASVPVVVSDRVGVADIVRRHHAGLVVAPTIDAITGALRRYVDSPESRSNDAHRARAAALEDASFARHGAELMAHYERLLSTRS
jgi:glycosyltransferase involved in cell wall biosynthesis